MDVKKTKDSIKVVIRLRPLLPSEEGKEIGTEVQDGVNYIHI